MGLFDKLKPNKNNKDFFEWLDLILKNELNEKPRIVSVSLHSSSHNYNLNVTGMKT